MHSLLPYERRAEESNLRATPEPTDRLHQAVADFAARQREAVQHLVVQDCSLAEAAAATGGSRGSLKVNLHLALNNLRARLGQWGEPMLSPPQKGNPVTSA